MLHALRVRIKINDDNFHNLFPSPILPLCPGFPILSPAGAALPVPLSSLLPPLTASPRRRLSGLSPFMGDDDSETLVNVTMANWDFDDDSFDEISDDAKSFIEDLLVKDVR